MKYKYRIVLSFVLTLCLVLGGCGTSTSTNNDTASESAGNEQTLLDQMSQYGITPEYSSFDLDQDESTINATIIKGNGDSVEVSGVGAVYENGVLTINCKGTYVLSGEMNDAQIVINAEDAKVKLILNGLDLACTTASPIYVANADKVSLCLATNTTNTVTDRRTTSDDSEIEDESTTEDNTYGNAAIYSKSSITVNGYGSLVVNADYNNGIYSKKTLKILSGSVTVVASKCGIKSKNAILIKDGTITVDSQADGIKTTNVEDTDKGYIYIEGGTVNVTSNQDGISASQYLYVIGGEINVKTTGEVAVSNTDSMQLGQDMGGSGADNQNGQQSGQQSGEAMQMPDQQSGGMMQMPGQQSGEAMQMPDQQSGEAMQMPGQQNGETMQQPDQQGQESDQTEDAGSYPSTKGIKAGIDMMIAGGNIIVNAASHCVHCSGSIEIVGGFLDLTSNYGKGISAHGDLVVDGAETVIVVEKSTEGLESKKCLTVNDGTIRVLYSDDDGFNTGGTVSEEEAEEHRLTINGGYIYVYCTGDGLDSNGDAVVNGGTIVVMGPNTSMDSSFDSEYGVTYNGGTMLGLASSNAMWSQDIIGNIDGGDYIYNTQLGSVTEGDCIAVLDSNGNVLSVIQSAFTGNIGIVYMNSNVDDISSCTFSVGCTYTGQLNEDGYAEEGSVTGGNEQSPSTQSENGNFGGMSGSMGNTGNTAPGGNVGTGGGNAVPDGNTGGPGNSTAPGGDAGTAGTSSGSNGV